MLFPTRRIHSSQFNKCSHNCFAILYRRSTTTPHDYSFSEQLGLNKLSFLERYSLVIFLFTACFGLPLISQYILNITSIFTLIISLCLAILVSALSLYTCSENYRRSTFHWLLSKEILRRKGLDRPNTSRISLYAIRTNPNT